VIGGKIASVALGAFLTARHAHRDPAGMSLAQIGEFSLSSRARRSSARRAIFSTR
jgi:hypothetical protein